MLHYGHIVFTRIYGQLARFLREDDTLLQYSGHVILPVVMLYLIKLRLQIQLLDEESVKCRLRCGKERTYAIFGIELDGAEYASCS